jgi:hypothetical protein
MPVPVSLVTLVKLSDSVVMQIETLVGIICLLDRIIMILPTTF